MRLVIVASLITTSASFTSFASADQPRFAQPPPGAAKRVAAANLRYEQMPMRPLDRAQIRMKLATNRASNVTRFREYQAAGVFPSNTYQSNKLNVWLDEAGHFCAAATIIRMSGGVALADKVAEQNNFIKLGAVTQGPVMDWILTSGLTQAEIAAIQEPFDGVSDDPRMQPGIVNNDLRRREDARLRAKYRQVEAQIGRNIDTSLEAATTRLMKNPSLARQLLAS